MFGSTPVVKNIIKLNIGLFLLQYLTNGTAYDVSRWLSLYDYRATYFGPWQYVTHMFIHSDFTHIFFNMVPVVILGPHLEKLLGAKKFLLFYLLIGLAAGMATNLLHTFEINEVIKTSAVVKDNLNGENAFEFIRTTYPGFFERNHDAYLTFMNYLDHPGNMRLISDILNIIDGVINSIINMSMLGASGAVFGVLMGAALYFPNMQLILFPIPIPIKLKWLVLFYAITEFYAGVKPIPGDNVAHFAHLSGMLFALVFYAFWKKKAFNNQRNY